MYDINVEAARLAKRCAPRMERPHARQAAARRRRAGPDEPYAQPVAATSTTLDIAPTPSIRSRPRTRNRRAALLDGGVDLLLLETISDTLNAKAAIFAMLELLEAARLDVPIMISVTIVDQSGRTLSGQTIDAFWTSVAHAKPLSVGINCALGARADATVYGRARQARAGAHQLLPERRPAECIRWLRRNAGRIPLGSWRNSPTAGLVNVVGGCCGTTPDHIARGRRAGPARRRRAAFRSSSRLTRFSGFETLTMRTDSQLHDDRRAHQRHRQQEVREPDQGRRLTPKPSQSPRNRCEAAPTSSTSTWTKRCSTPKPP